MSHPKVSVVIVNWNNLADTVECLDSLRSTTYPNYEVVVVDNGSNGNDVEELERRFGDCTRLIRNERNYGFGDRWIPREFARQGLALRPQARSAA